MIKRFGIYFSIGILATAFLFSSGCQKQQLIDNGTGMLKGVIDIGPLCPVERVPPDPACLPTAETYKAYPVVIKSSDGSRVVKEITPGLDGKYTIIIPDGEYLLVLNKQMLAGGSNLPASITISSGVITSFDINIDTGIR
jgi:hypothetical protein